MSKGVWQGLGMAIALSAMTAGGVVIATQGNGDAVQANLFVVASGGSPSCVRSSSLIEYDAAVSANAVCGPGNGNVGFDATGFDNACDAANSGDIVGVKNGSYAQNLVNGALMIAAEDCAPGAGDYNPNWEEQGVSEGNLAAWTTFLPADDPQAITFIPNSFTLFPGNYHMIWKDIDINTGVKIGTGGDPTRVQNLVIRGNSQSDRANIHGIQVLGAKNVLFQHLDYGPSTQCGKANDANVPDTFECDPDAPTFESQYSNYGTASAGCGPGPPNPLGGLSSLCGGYFDGGGDWVELYIHNASTSDYLNIRLHDVINHDQQGKLDGEGVHPGCLMGWDYGNNPSAPSHNIVLDHYVCFRPTGQNVAFGDSGTTIQNSVFGCQVQSLQNTGGNWDGPCTNAPMGLAQKVGSNSMTNVLIRYNTFIGLSNGGSNVIGLLIQNSGAYDPDITNVRVVGNVFLGGGVTCSISGVTYDSNTFQSGLSTCGTNATSLAAGDPITDSSYDLADGTTPDLEGDTFDPTADGSPSLPTLNPTTLNTACGCTDYTLDHDFEGDARSSTATKPGADG